MFFDKLPQRLRIGLRPDETAAKAGVALVINRCAMCQSESEEASVARPEDQAWEAAQTSGDLKFSFHELRSSASEAPCRSGAMGFAAPAHFGQESNWSSIFSLQVGQVHIDVCDLD
jgi:hypothetical protein